MRAWIDNAGVSSLADVQASEALVSLLRATLWNRVCSILTHDLMQGIERRMDYGEHDDLWRKH